MPLYIAALHANGMPNEVIVDHIAPHIHPFFQYYVNRIKDKSKATPISYPSLSLINESKKLLLEDQNGGNEMNKELAQPAQRKRRISYFGFTEWY